MNRFLNYLRATLHRWTAPSPELTPAQIDEWLQQKMAPYTTKLDRAVAEHEAAKTECDRLAAEHFVAKARYDDETLQLRELVNMGLAKCKARVEMYWSRN